MSLSALTWKSLAFGYGALALSAFLILSTFRKANFRKLSVEDERELKAARNKLWNLSLRPYGLSHRFLTLRSGARLHYVESLYVEQPTNQNLVIFIHGYPDSYALWTHYLQSSRLVGRTNMVAVDLPGFGGSDSLARYGPAEVLEAITEFILQMRDKHLTGDGKVIVVSHDWGALIAYRLASEAPQLADRFVMANCVHPPVAISNAQNRLASARQMLKTWLRSPFNISLIRKAFSNILPVIRQVVKSGYVFVFNLPYPLANVVGNVGDFWWYRYLNAVSTHPDPSKPLSGTHGMELLASSVGPSTIQCGVVFVNSHPELAYSDSVRERANTGGSQEKLTYYRHGLAFSPWEKSLETLWELNQIQEQGGRRRSSSAGALFDTGPKGSLKAPATIIWGKSDIALETSLALEGFKDFFGASDSQIIQIRRCGHWSPLEKQAVPIFEEVIEWTLGGEKVGIREQLGDSYPMAEILSER